MAGHINPSSCALTYSIYGFYYSYKLIKNVRFCYDFIITCFSSSPKSFFLMFYVMNFAFLSFFFFFSSHRLTEPRVWHFLRRISLYQQIILQQTEKKSYSMHSTLNTFKAGSCLTWTQNVWRKLGQSSWLWRSHLMVTREVTHLEIWRCSIWLSQFLKKELKKENWRKNWRKKELKKENKWWQNIICSVIICFRLESTKTMNSRTCGHLFPVFVLCPCLAYNSS